MPQFIEDVNTQGLGILNGRGEEKEEIVLQSSVHVIDTPAHWAELSITDEGGYRESCLSMYLQGRTA